MTSRVLAKILSGSSDANIRFTDLRATLRKAGFEERKKGSHHIFSKPGVEEILNLQPRGSMANPARLSRCAECWFDIDLQENLNDEIRDHSVLERGG